MAGDSLPRKRETSAESLPARRCSTSSWRGHPERRSQDGRGAIRQVDECTRPTAENPSGGHASHGAGEEPDLAPPSRWPASLKGEQRGARVSSTHAKRWLTEAGASWASPAAPCPRGRRRRLNRRDGSGRLGDAKTQGAGAQERGGDRPHGREARGWARRLRLRERRRPRTPRRRPGVGRARPAVVRRGREQGEERAGGAGFTMPSCSSVRPPAAAALSREIGVQRVKEPGDLVEVEVSRPRRAAFPAGEGPDRGADGRGHLVLHQPQLLPGPRHDLGAGAGDEECHDSPGIGGSWRVFGRSRARLYDNESAFGVSRGVRTVKCSSPSAERRA